MWIFIIVIMSLYFIRVSCYLNYSSCFFWKSSIDGVGVAIWYFLYLWLCNANKWGFNKKAPFKDSQCSFTRNSFWRFMWDLNISEHVGYPAWHPCRNLDLIRLFKNMTRFLESICCLCSNKIVYQICIFDIMTAFQYISLKFGLFFYCFSFL